MVTRHRPTTINDDLIVALHYIDPPFKSKGRHPPPPTPPILIYIGADVDRQHPSRDINILARWDDKAKVWAATSDDTLGVVTSAPDNKSLEADLRVCVPELLELNGLRPVGGGTRKFPTSPRKFHDMRMNPMDTSSVRSMIDSGGKVGGRRDY